MQAPKGTQRYTICIKDGIILLVFLFTCCGLHLNTACSCSTIFSQFSHNCCFWSLMLPPSPQEDRTFSIFFSSLWLFSLLCCAFQPVIFFRYAVCAKKALWARKIHHSIKIKAQCPHMLYIPLTQTTNATLSSWFPLFRKHYLVKTTCLNAYEQSALRTTAEKLFFFPPYYCSSSCRSLREHPTISEATSEPLSYVLRQHHSWVSHNPHIMCTPHCF